MESGVCKRESDMESVDVNFSTINRNGSEITNIQNQEEPNKISPRHTEVDVGYHELAKKPQTIPHENVPTTSRLHNEEAGRCLEEQEQVNLVDDQKGEGATNIKRRGLINLCITWFDDKTLKSTELKWSHDDCVVCTNNLDDWKKHIQEAHRTLAEIVQMKKISPARDKSSRKRTKSSDKKSCEKISGPCLADSQLITKNIQDLSRRGKNKIKDPSKMASSTGKTNCNKRKPVVVITEQVKSERTVIVQRTRSSKKRKQSHPCKLEPVDFSPDVSDDSNFVPDALSDDPDFPEISEDADFREASDDSDILPSSKTCLRRRKQKKQMADENGKPNHACSRESCSLLFSTVKERKRHEREDHDAVKYKCRFKECGGEFKNQKWKEST